MKVLSDEAMGDERRKTMDNNTDMLAGWLAKVRLQGCGVKWPSQAVMEIWLEALIASRGWRDRTRAL
jgi:hypothetical protein